MFTNAERDMSTMHFSTSGLVPYLAAIVKPELTYQPDLRANQIERWTQYLKESGVQELFTAFAKDNAAAFNKRYNETQAPAILTSADIARVAALALGLERLDVRVLADQVCLLAYNLDDEATLDSMAFCLRATNGVLKLAAQRAGL
jgi:hypothetical protein